ncbi:MAG: hypothetical protein ABIP35_08985 [Ginsengibacter sp.]
MLYKKLGKYFFVFVLTTSFFGWTSCSTTQVVSKYDCDTFAHNPLNQKTTWSFLWGLVQPKDIIPHCDERSNHMNKVTVKNNYAFALLTVVTLGIVMPQKIEWCCAPYSPQTESLGH